MKLTNFGGATAILEHAGKRILFDPWLDDGIFHGAWYHYPPLQIGIEQLGHIDYVYISHIHEDHCSAGTIRHINRDAEIILMERTPNLVGRFLERHGFHFRKVHLVSPRTPLQLEPGLVVDIVEPDPTNEMSHLIDSALLIRWDDFVIYNANDCQPYPAGMQYILDTYRKVDLALLPYSAGSGYPACYLNLDESAKQAEKQRVVTGRLRAFVEATRVLQPRWVMPFADQYVVAGARAHLNSMIAHPASPAVVQAALAEQGLAPALLLNSGQAFDFSAGCKLPDEPYQELGDAARTRYIADHLQALPYEYERFQFGPSVSLDRLVRHARAQMWQAQRRQAYFPAFRFYLDTTDSARRFELALDSEEVRTLETDSSCCTPFLRIAVPHDLLIMLLLGHVSWNIADAALFLDYERVPNDYDPMLYAMLNYLRM
jgi:UDP-MurNAc hydroxylase